MIFAVFDVLLAVNMCINYSFFYIYVSYIGDKIVVTAICIYLYPHVDGYKLLYPDTCIRLHVSGVNAA